MKNSNKIQKNNIKMQTLISNICNKKQGVCKLAVFSFRSNKSNRNVKSIRSFKMINKR